MNRKGDIPTILLFFICLFLIGFALFSFNSIGGKFGNTLSDVNRVYKEVIISEEFLQKSILKLGVESKCNKEEFVRISRESPRLKNLDPVFEKLEYGEFDLSLDGEGCSFKIENLKFKAEREDVRLERNYDLEMAFSLSSKLIKLEKVYK